MGLLIVPGGAEWGFHGFMQFRRRLALAEGFDLFRYEPYLSSSPLYPGHSVAPDGAPIHPGHVIRAREITSVLKPLFDHEDNEGALSAGECGAMVDRLEHIVTSWPERDEDGDIDQGRAQGLRLVEGMREVVATGGVLEFHG